jgi:hypothetical protein
VSVLPQHRLQRYVLGDAVLYSDPQGGRWGYSWRICAAAGRRDRTSGTRELTQGGVRPFLGSGTAAIASSVGVGPAGALVSGGVCNTHCGHGARGRYGKNGHQSVQDRAQHRHPLQCSPGFHAYCCPSKECDSLVYWHDSLPGMCKSFKLASAAESEPSSLLHLEPLWQRSAICVSSEYGQGAAMMTRSWMIRCTNCESTKYLSPNA